MRFREYYKNLYMVDELKAKGVRLKLACDNVGIGVSTYYKLRKR
ncbi:Transposon Tn21 resolvase (fragment) [Xenorhabdus szentirmaii DSM 16338]|uniref:Transposon Tn21 resolvase n=1 Tax=Xenorhabdus szentirmaii DSM 16338 TaxID=1427518 RepID=W1J410_9GAMM